MELKQYQVVLVNLEPTVGYEMKNTRPSVIISPDEMNRHLQTIIIAPMTSISRAYPTRVAVHYKRRKGWIVLDQVRTVDRKWIVRIAGQLKEAEVNNIKAVLKEMFVD